MPDDSKRKKEISLLSAFAAGALASPKPDEIKNFEQRIAEHFPHPSTGFIQARNAVKAAVQKAVKAGRAEQADFLSRLDKETRKLSAQKNNPRVLAAQALRWAINNKAQATRRVSIPSGFRKKI